MVEDEDVHARGQEKLDEKLNAVGLRGKNFSLNAGTHLMCFKEGGFKACMI